LPSADALTERRDDPGDLMTGYGRIGDPGKAALLHVAVAVADPARLSSHERLPVRWRGHVPLHQLEGAAGLADLDRSHARHRLCTSLDRVGIAAPGRARRLERCLD